MRLLLNSNTLRILISLFLCIFSLGSGDSQSTVEKETNYQKNNHCTERIDQHMNLRAEATTGPA